MAIRREATAPRALLVAVVMAAAGCGGSDPAAACGSAAECDDGFSCTVDTCDAALGCTHTPDAAACSDGVDCTADACDPASPDAAPSTGCVSLPVHASCDDQDACTVDTCVAASGCSHVALPGWFEDADGDGHGDPDVSVCAAAAPAGFVGVAGDCCDASSDTYPGQAGWFDTANGCGGFDYDCSGTAVARHPSVASCESAGAACTGSDGWAGAVPPCGATGSYQTGCFAVSCGAGCWTCGTNTSPRAQACR